MKAYHLRSIRRPVGGFAITLPQGISQDMHHDASDRTEVIRWLYT